ncbi:fungal pheromone STE3G-protein-coupled receptor, partial [Polychaeton citri CBS 116435]
YPSAVGLAIASIFVIILMLPPMWWHARNRNLGATLLVGWLVLLNLFTFINALIWPNDDISNWYDGNVLCDIQVKFQIAARVGAPAANACVLRALAIVMDTDRATLGQSAAERRRNHTVELLWAVGFPLSMFLAHYIVQWNRYYLFGISGCVAGVSDSWVTLVLINLPGPVWTLVNVYYAVLILIRLHKYRVSFTSLLESRGTTRSRFLRLFCLCIFWLLVSLPVQFYVLFVNINVTHSPYSWTEIHDTERWRTIVMIPSDGRVIFDRYIWLGGGIMVFVFFGMGKDAMAMYKGGLCTIGLGRVFPSLKAGQQALPPASYGSTFSSIGSKAKMLFRRK